MVHDLVKQGLLLAAGAFIIGFAQEIGGSSAKKLLNHNQANYIRNENENNSKDKKPKSIPKKPFWKKFGVFVAT